MGITPHFPTIGKKVDYMVIRLYQNLSERNAINKTLSNERIFNGTLRGETSVKIPVINLAGDETIVNYNYAYIEDFNRYYFITDIKSIRKTVWEVSFLCDVLMSFKADILQSRCIVDHTETHKTSDYLSSDIWTTLVKDKTDIINFSGSSLLESGEYILITAGG